MHVMLVRDRILFTDVIQIPQLQKDKKIFFASDFHLPLRFSYTNTHATDQEDKVLAWLDYIKPQAQALFLLGDIFDFWFEYKYLIPKGFIRLQTKLLAFHKEQIPVYFFLGNHDCWSIDYLTQECGVQIFRKPASITISNQKFLVGHGDTINPTICYALLHKLYTNVLLQSIIKILPADWLYGIVRRYLLRDNRNNSVFEQNDRIFQHCKDKIECSMHHNFYIFGHIHVPYIKELNHSSTYCNLGDWISHYTYACFDGLILSLLKF